MTALRALTAAVFLFAAACDGDYAGPPTNRTVTLQEITFTHDFGSAGAGPKLPKLPCSDDAGCSALGPLLPSGTSAKCNTSARLCVAVTPFSAAASVELTRDPAVGFRALRATNAGVNFTMPVNTLTFGGQEIGLHIGPAGSQAVDSPGVEKFATFKLPGPGIPEPNPQGGTVVNFGPLLSALAAPRTPLTFLLGGAPAAAGGENPPAGKFQIKISTVIYLQ